MIKPIIIVIEHRAILPIWTNNRKISPRSEKRDSFIVKSKIRLVTPFDRHPSPWRIDSVIVIEILLLVIYVNVRSNAWNVFFFIDKIPIDVSEKFKLCVVVWYVSQGVVVNILINVLDLILAVVQHHLNLHWWIYYNED